MKKTTNLLLMAFTVIAIAFTSCKKEPGPKGDTGATGPQGPAGPSAKTYTFNGVFGPSTQYISYSGLVGDFNTDDMVLTYILNATYGGDDYYIQLPYVANGLANVYAEVNENNGHLYVNTDKANGTSGSPWSSVVTFKFKAVLIRSSQIIKGVDYNNYLEVAKAYNIKD